MTDEAGKLAEEQARQDSEAALVANRIRELHAKPIEGNFDAEHLKAVHAYIFQDFPEYHPGIVRADSDGWNKERALEGQGPSHVVRYLHEGVEARITAILRNLAARTRSGV